jgi:Crinkler effector protein N-terminal domain
MIHPVLPPSLPSAPILELYCVVEGDDPNHVFLVKIARTESVGMLKKAIKEEKKVAFEHVDADSLQLWKVSMEADDRLKENVEELALREEKVLSSVARLSTVFSDKLQDERVHVIVGPAPLIGECTSSVALSVTDRDPSSATRGSS